MYAAFEAEKTFDHIESIRQLLKLQGYNPDKLAQESFQAHDFTARAMACHRPYENDESYERHILRHLNYGMRYASLHPMMNSYDREESIAEIEAVFVEEIGALKQLITALRALDDASLAEAETRAMVPDDTRETRLILRYKRESSLSLDRTLKTLLKVQKQRTEEAESAAEEAEKRDSRNEANSGANASSVWDFLRESEPREEVELVDRVGISLDINDNEYVEAVGGVKMRNSEVVCEPPNGV